MADIAEFIVELEKEFSELKLLSRNMSNPNNKRMIELALDMRWQLANILTVIGKVEDEKDNNVGSERPQGPIRQIITRNGIYDVSLHDVSDKKDGPKVG